MAAPQKPEFEIDVMERLNSASRRIRQLEENIRSIRDHLTGLENEFVKQKEDRNSFNTNFNKKEEQIKIAITNLGVEVKNINRRLRKVATNRELQEIESYIQIFNPLKSSFVTKKEVQKMIEKYRGGDLE